MGWKRTEDGRMIWQSESPLMRGYTGSGNIVSGAGQSQIGKNYGVNLPSPRNAVSGVLGLATPNPTTSNTTAPPTTRTAPKPTVNKKQQFKSGEISNKYGNYSVGNIADKLGIDRNTLKARAKAAGFSNTLDYYNSLKNQAPQRTFVSGYQDLISKLTGKVTPQGSVLPWQGLANMQSTMGAFPPNVSGTVAGAAVGPQMQSIPGQWNNISGGYNTGNTVGGSPNLGNAPAPAPTPGGPNPFEDIVKTQGDLLGTQEDQLQLDYEKLMADLGLQKQSLTGQYGIFSNNLTNANTNLQNQLSTQRQESISGAEANKQANYETARNTTSANRNILRALGILGSSAAGEILSRPLVAADRATAEQTNILTKRLNELDTISSQINQDTMAKKAELDNNYMTMLSQIENDIRFGEEQKTLAIQELQNAYAANIQNLQLQKLQYDNTLAQQQQANQLALAQILAYTNPSNVQGILGTQLRV